MHIERCQKCLTGFYGIDVRKYSRCPICGGNWITDKVEVKKKVEIIEDEKLIKNDNENADETDYTDAK